MEYYIFHSKCNAFRYHNCPQIARIQVEMTKEGQFLRRSELNGRSIFVVDKSQNLMDTTIRGVAEVKKVGGTGTKQDVNVISDFALLTNDLLPYTPIRFFLLGFGTISS